MRQVAQHGFRRGGIAALLAIALLPGGCDRSGGKSSHSSEAISHKVESDDAEVRCTMSAPKITLAQTLDITVDLISKDPIRDEIVDVEKSLPEDWSVVDVHRDRLLDPDGRSISRSVYKVEPFLPGDYEIAPIVVEYSRDGTPEVKERLETIPVPIRVLSPIDPAAVRAGPADLRGIVDPTGPWKGWWWIGGGALGLVVLTAIVGLALYRRRQAAWVERYRYRAAHEIALEALDALGQSGVIEREEYEILYVLLSDILRRYLAHRFDIHAPERTTEEILAEAKRTSFLNESQLDLLNRFLSYCDLVKFAARPTVAADAHQAFEVVRSFVKATQLNRPDVILDAQTGEYVGRLEFDAKGDAA